MMSAAFPLEPISSIDSVGCLSRSSIVEADQTLFWVASDGTVRRLAGYAAQVVSSDDIAEAIASTTDKANIQALAWVDRGNTMIEFSCADWTYVLNLATGFWHEQKSYEQSRWRAAWSMNLAGRHIVGDYASANLYELDPNTYTDAGDALVSEVHMGIDRFPRGFTLDTVEVQTFAGVGLNNPSAHLSDPEMMIAVSRDQGRTWPVERRAKLGKIGEYGTRTYAHGFGTCLSSGRVRLSISAAVRRGISGVSIDAEGLK